MSTLTAVRTTVLSTVRSCSGLGSALADLYVTNTTELNAYLAALDPAATSDDWDSIWPELGYADAGEADDALYGDPGILKSDIADAWETYTSYLYGLEITPNSTPTHATLWFDPSLDVVDVSTPREVYSENGGIGHRTVLNDEGITGVYEGSVYAGEFLSVAADTVNGVGAKNTFTNINYYNINANSEYVEWNYSGIDADRVFLHLFSSTAGNNGTVEIYRVRSAVETVLGTYDPDIDLGGSDSRVIVSLSDTVVSGDSLGIRRLSTGPVKNVRLRAVALASSTKAIASSDDLVFDGFGTYTLEPGSSKEFAVSMAPTGQANSFVGNVAHQTPQFEDNRTVLYEVDTVDITSTQGAASGDVRITRAADFDYNDTDWRYASFDIISRWTVHGIRFDHTITFNESTDVVVFYVGMLPADPSSDVVYPISGSEVDISVDDESTVTLGTVSQVHIAETSGLSNALVINTDATLAATIYKSTGGSGNKIYMRNTAAEITHGATDTIVSGWDLLLGVKYTP